MSNHPATESTTTRLRDWWLRDKQTGEITLGQRPNPAILVWLVTALVRWLDVWPERSDELRWIGAGALVVWGLDELVRGANPLRRLVGALVLGWQLVRLVG